MDNVKDLKENITIIHSNRKTISIQIKRNLQIIVRAPLHMKVSDIKAFLVRKADWMQKHLEMMQAQKEEELPFFSKEEIKALVEAAKADIPNRVKHYAEQMGVAVGHITIRTQRTRWGSCSGTGNLNFNCLLMLCPVEVRDYVVVHELCHRKQLNHSDAFWAEVSCVMPDYATHRKWLKTNGIRLIGRIPT